MSNMFEKAKAAPVKPVRKASAKPEKEKVTIKGIANHAALKVVMDSIETLLKSEAASIKSTALAHFVSTGMKKQARPDNFRGVEDEAETSVELRRMSSRSILSPEAIEVLEQHSIPLSEKDEVVETFIINPKYADLGDKANAKLMARVSDALKNIVPDDFLEFQSNKIMTVTDESMDAIFKLKDADDVAQCLELCGVIALKPTTDVGSAMEKVAEILGLAPAPNKAKAKA